jgi:hypothetical protein
MKLLAKFKNLLTSIAGDILGSLLRQKKLAW